MKSIKQIAEDFSYYIPGDMKRFKKAIIAEGYDLVGIQLHSNYNGWGVAVSEVTYVDPNECDFVTVEIDWG